MPSHKFISPIRVSLITNTIRRDSFSFSCLHLTLFYPPPSPPGESVRTLRCRLMRITNFISNRYIYLCRWCVSSLGVSPSTSVVYPHRSTLDINRDHFMVSAFPETQEAISLTAKRLAEPERLLTAFHLRSTALPLLVSIRVLSLSLALFPSALKSACFSYLRPLESRLPCGSPTSLLIVSN